MASDVELADLLQRVAIAISASEVPFKPQLAPKTGRLVIWDLAIDQSFQMVATQDDLKVRRLTLTFEPRRETARSFARAAARSTGSVTHRSLPDGRVEIRCSSPYAVDDATRDPDALAQWTVRTLEGFHRALEAVVPAAKIRGASPTMGTTAVEATATRMVAGELGPTLDPSNASVVPNTLWDRSTSPAEDRDGGVPEPEAHHLDSDPGATVVVPPAIDRPTHGSPDVEAITELSAVILREPELRPQFRAEVLRRLSALAQADVRLRERFAEAVLRSGSPTEAAEVIGAVARDELSPSGAAVLLECTLRMQRTPDVPMIQLPIDWTVGSVVDQLLDAQRWMPVEQQLRLTRVMCDPALPTARPPRINEWLEAIGAKAPAKALQGVLECIHAVDEELGTEQLLEWVGRRGLEVTLAWVCDYLELYGLESDDARVARKSFDRLIEVVRRRKDFDRVGGLWQWAVRRWGPEAASMGESIVMAALPHARTMPELTQLGVILSEVIGYQLASSGQPSEEARTLAATLIARDPTLNTDLAALVRRPEPANEATEEPTAITKVVDAVQLARLRYPGLVVLDTALESSRKRGSLQARRSWEVLQSLGEIGGRYQADADHDVDESLRALSGYRADISDTAKAKFRMDYARQLPDGREVLLGPHLPTGPGGRVYFYIDRGARQLVIGHVGSHLRGKD